MSASQPSANPQIKKIVVLNPHEWLEESFQSRSMAPGKAVLESSIGIDGMEFDEQAYPVRLEDQFLLPASFDDESSLQNFIERNPNDVARVFSNPELTIFNPVCPGSGPIGDELDVRHNLNLQPLIDENSLGTGVRVVIVDTGIDGTQINVVGGYSPRPGVTPGNSPSGHGTMVAYDTQIAAPNSMIFDYALLQSNGNTWVAFLADAIRAFSEILIDHNNNPGPMVVVNSWGMYDKSGDAPIGDPQNYSHNSNHPFNGMVRLLADSGIDIVFAAGNCGSTCPDNRCGANDIGPGNSIHGANSHPEVVSVAAVTVNDELLGYSSEGPGALAQEKPDIAGFSHFSGSGVYPADSGTSAACPIVAGVIAALRSNQRGRNLAVGDMADLLRRSARNVLPAAGWSPQFGTGIIDAGNALRSLT